MFFVSLLRPYNLNKVVRSRSSQALLFSKMGNSSTRSFSPNSAPSRGSSQECGTICKTGSSNEYVESIVCNENDLQENEMKVFDVSEDGKVLLVKQKGQFSAVGTKCSHYGAPLVTGALGEGRVRCPWHGACFNLKTGDIEDFPGFDSIPCYQVSVTEKGEVKVRAKIADLKENKRVRATGTTSCCDKTTFVVVGAGPSGATCAETLRSEGFKGRIVVIGKENLLPYDRIKVSKVGSIPSFDKIQARTEEYYKSAHIEFITGVEAVKIDTNGKLVHLSNGNKVGYNSLYLATGSKPRVPDIPGVNLKNVFTVRNYPDYTAILEALGTEKNKNVVVLGLSFIGLECAASCVEKAGSMTAVGKDNFPLEAAFGAEIGKRLQQLFEEKGVTFKVKNTIVQCNGENGNISSVELTDGTVLPADILIMGVGTTFYTDFLRDSGIEMQPNGAVSVSDKLETNVKNIFAGGDIANAPVFSHNNVKANIGHIGLAQYHGKMAALNMLNKDAPLRSVPVFWTMVFGKSIRYAGYGKHSSIQIEGSIEEMKFVIFFFDASNRVIAVASCMRDPVVAQFAELLYQGKSLTKDDLKNDPFAWVKSIH